MEMSFRKNDIAEVKKSTLQRFKTGIANTRRMTVSIAKKGVGFLGGSNDLMVDTNNPNKPTPKRDNNAPRTTTIMNETTNELVDKLDIMDAIVTIKNYGTKKGLSKAMFDMIKDDIETPIIEVQGPMGKGLEIQKTGTHIAYTAGTGILVFMDLVAHLIRKNLNLLSDEDDRLLDGKNFKFILYASFPNEADCCGVDLCVGLCSLCAKLDI